MLLPQAALQKTMASESGDMAVKQMGQSPSMGLRLDGEEGAVREGGRGAWEKISRSSCAEDEYGVCGSEWERSGVGDGGLRRRGGRLGIGGVRGL